MIGQPTPIIPETAAANARTWNRFRMMPPWKKCSLPSSSTRSRHNSAAGNSGPIRYGKRYSTRAWARQKFPAESANAPPNVLYLRVCPHLNPPPDPDARHPYSDASSPPNASSTTGLIES